MQALLRQLACGGIGKCINLPDQFRKLPAFVADAAQAHFLANPSKAFGVCISFNTFPPPRYMCTPQGKHGSKLRTARIMSMPLNVSGPFSSKMGVFCTASS